MSQITGHISQIIGAVIDVYFDTEGQDAEKVLPKIHDALRVDRGDGRVLIVEVQQHIGEDTVRCVAMDNTDGLHRGMEVIPLGTPIQMPAGDQIKMNACLPGCVWNATPRSRSPLERNLGFWTQA